MAPTRTRQRAARIAAILGIISLVSGVAGGLDRAGAAVTTVSVNPSPNPSITDGSTTTSTASVSAGAGAVSDISVTVGTTHSRLGDLTYTLTHMATGTSVVLLDRPGTVDASNGDNSNLLATSPITFTAGPATAAELMGSGAGMSTNATACLTDAVCTYQAHGTLSSFDGLAATGDWRLTITDTSNQDTGSFDQWSITVTSTDAPVPHAPVAGDDAFATDEDTPLTVTAAGLLGGDTDEDAGTTLTVAGTGTPAHGELSAVGTDGSFTYTPDADWHGDDTFTYTVSDGALTDTGTATITVASVNDGPTAQDDALTTDEDTPGSVDVVANDSDLEGDPLDVSDATQGAHGTVDCLAGICTYTPDAGYAGPDAFTYTVADLDEGSDTASVQVTVTAAPDEPQDPQCEQDEVLVDGVCTTPDPEVPVCDEGDVLVDGICTTPEPEEPMCDEGDVLVDGICTTPDPEEPPLGPVDEDFGVTTTSTTTPLPRVTDVGPAQQQGSTQVALPRTGSEGFRLVPLGLGLLLLGAALVGGRPRRTT